MRLAEVDVAAGLREAPEDPDWVLPGLPGGAVGVLAGEPGVGKSWLALELSLEVAVGAPALGVAVATGSPARAVYLTSEDAPPVLRARLHAVARAVPGLAERLMDSGDLRIFEVAGANLADPRHSAEIARAGSGARLLVFDTLSRFHAGDENSREGAARVMRALEKLARETGAAVLALHHLSKRADENRQLDGIARVRGSSVFVAEPRAVFLLEEMRRGRAGRHEIGLTLAKSNYASEVFFRFWRGPGGMLLPAAEPAARSRSGKVKGGAPHDF